MQVTDRTFSLATDAVQPHKVLPATWAAVPGTDRQYKLHPRHQHSQSVSGSKVASLSQPLSNCRSPTLVAFFNGSLPCTNLNYKSLTRQTSTGFRIFLWNEGYLKSWLWSKHDMHLPFSCVLIKTAEDSLRWNMYEISFYDVNKIKPLTDNAGKVMPKIDPKCLMDLIQNLYMKLKIK